MTICVTACVEDGIVMGVDSRLTRNTFYEGTGQNYKEILSNNHQKLWVLNNKYGLMAHGQFDFEGKDMNVIVEEFKTYCLKESELLSLTAYKLFKFFIENYPTLNTHFWLSGFENNKPTIFHINENKLEIKNFIQGDIDCGFYYGGNDLGINIAKSYVENENVDYSKLSLDRSEELVRNSIREVISKLNSSVEYSDCGGKTRLYRIANGKNVYKEYD